jgi:hypothetical protein
MGDETNFNFRVSATLKQAFLDACERQDSTASQVLRRFMRAYVEQHAQTDLEQVIKRQARKDGR